MIIHSRREHDRSDQGQQKQLEEDHKRRMDVLDELEAIWQSSPNQDVIDRTTRNVNVNEVDDDDYSTIPTTIIDDDSDGYFTVDD